MLFVSDKTHANVAARLPQSVIAGLKAEREALGLRSVSAVVERRLQRCVDNGFVAGISRQPLSGSRVDLAFRRHFVDLLKEIAKDQQADLGSLIYSATADLRAPSRLESVSTRSHHSVDLSGARAA